MLLLRDDANAFFPFDIERFAVNARAAIDRPRYSHGEFVTANANTTNESQHTIGP